MLAGIYVVTIAVLVSIFWPTFAPGDLDLLFDSDGRITTDVGGGRDTAQAVAIQADGRIVVVGGSLLSRNQFSVVRYNRDGSLDVSFSSDGKQITNFYDGSNSYARGVTIQPDGKIIVVGTVGSDTVAGDFGIVRYNTDGSLDSSFGNGGKVIATIGPGEDSAYGVALSGDGKIVVAGTATNSTWDFAVARFLQNGSLDPTFDSDGIVTTTIGNADDQVRDVKILSNQMIAVSGFSFNGINNDFALVVYNNDGSLNNSFDFDGKVTTRFGTGEDICTGLVEQSDGRILVTGYSRATDFQPSRFDFALARYLSDGSLDTTFGKGGKVTTSASSGDDVAYGVALQSNGKIVIVGTSFSLYEFAIARYTPAGSPDMSFGTGGVVTTSFESGQAFGYGLAVQPNGRIVAVGAVLNGSTAAEDFAVARFMGDAVPVQLVSFTGRVVTPDGRGFRNAVVTLTDSSGMQMRSTTSSFGIYSFLQIPGGAAYVIGVNSKRYRFASREIEVSSGMSSVDFVGAE